ncbi:unnamed protein product, partial [Rotaria socialis]
MVAFVRIVRGRPGDILGGGMFANKTFANGEVPPNVLAKVQWTFANWRSSTECVGESTVDVRQLAKFHRMCWR